MERIHSHTLIYWSFQCKNVVSNGMNEVCLINHFWSFWKSVERSVDYLFSRLLLHVYMMHMIHIEIFCTYLSYIAI